MLLTEIKSRRELPQAPNLVRREGGREEESVCVGRVRVREREVFMFAIFFASHSIHSNPLPQF